MCGIPHFLIDELYPDEEYNVMIFQKKAREYMDGIYGRGDIPIVVGGTGFYITPLFMTMILPEEKESGIRRNFTGLPKKRGRKNCNSMLAEV